MGTFTDYTENKVLDHLTGKATFSAISPVFICLTTSPIDDASSGTDLVEPATTYNYWRKSTGAADWNSAVTGYSSNATLLTFATPSTPWGVITHFGLTTASTPGTGALLCWGLLNTSKTMLAGDQTSFAVGDFQITLD